jgi:hypothetical protein
MAVAFFADIIPSALEPDLICPRGLAIFKLFAV